LFGRGFDSLQLHPKTSARRFFIACKFPYFKILQLFSKYFKWQKIPHFYPFFTHFWEKFGAKLVQIYYKFITNPAFVINRNSNAVSWSIFPHVTSLYCEKRGKISVFSDILAKMISVFLFLLLSLHSKSIDYVFEYGANFKRKLYGRLLE